MRKFKALFFVMSLLLVSLHSLAEDVRIYTGKLILQRSTDVGALVSASLRSTGQIVVYRNKFEILRIPVMVNSYGLGLVVGVKSSAEVATQLEISGLRPETLVADFFRPYSGTANGVTIMPWTFSNREMSGSRETVSFSNIFGIEINGKQKNEGFRIDWAWTRVNISANTSYLERDITQTKNWGRPLSSFPELPYQMTQTGSVLKIKCTHTGEKRRVVHDFYMDQFVEIKYDSVETVEVFRPLKYWGPNPFSAYSPERDNPLKVWINNSVLHFAPEKIAGKQSSLRAEIDLASETISSDSLHPFQYHGKITKADATQTVLCLSRDSLALNSQVIESIHSSFWTGDR